MKAERISEPLAITGMGCISALGRDVAFTRASLFSAGLDPVPCSRFVTNHPEPFPVFEIPDAWLSCDSLDASSKRCSALARMAASEAITMGKIGKGDRGRIRIGLSMGTVAGDPFDEQGIITGQRPDWESLNRYVRGWPAVQVHRALSLDGPYQMVTTACSSGAVAIAQGAAWVRDGVCDAVLAGGAEGLTRICYDGFASLMLADKQRCKPFDRHRAGLNLGEGAGFLLLEHPDSARNRDAVILGWLLGDGIASDAYNLAKPKPDGTALRRAIFGSMERSGVKSEEIGFINAHGTGTADNDAVEARTFLEVLPGVPFVSTKAMTGHTLGAAGGIEALLTVISLMERRVPASMGFNDRCPECGCSPLSRSMTLVKSIAMSTSVGYGGSNCALIFAGASGRVA